jgi:hypothetical protein
VDCKEFAVLTKKKITDYMRFIRYIAAVLIAVCVCSSAIGQTPKPTVADIENMSISEFQAYQTVLKSQRRSETSAPPTIQKLQGYAEVGKSLGQAFKECWSVVSDDAERFAQSPAGKWTAFLITWKVMGNDAINLTEKFVRWVCGVIAWFVITPVFIFLVYRNCVSKRILKHTERTGLFAVKRIYSEQLYHGQHSSEIALYGLAYLVFHVGLGLVMFVG